MRFQKLLAGALGLLSLTWSAIAAPSPLASRSRAPLLGRAAPLKPANDPFYKPPSGYEKTIPGTVLRSRKIQPALFGDVPNPVQAWQLLYRTTAIDGKAIASVTTVFKPLIAKADRFVSYAPAYDSSATQCDPSYSYQLGSDASPISSSSVEILIIEAFLLQGYIVASPDYEGPDAAFSPGRLEGVGVLDNMRAVSNFGGTLGFSTKTPAIVGVGYSGGAIATGWAAALQPSYAPELPVKGWAHGGTPANLTAVIINVDNTGNTGFIPAALVGLAAPSAYGAQIQPILDKILTNKGREAIQYASTHCITDDLNMYKSVSFLGTEYQTLGKAILQQPDFAKVLAATILGGTVTETPKQPVLVIHGKQDEIIPYQVGAALVDRWCRNGGSVRFSTYEMADHAGGAILGLPEIFQFVTSAFAGSVPTGCSRVSHLTSTLDPMSLGLALAPILVKLAALLPH